MAVDRLKVMENTDAALGVRRFFSEKIPAEVTLPNLPDSLPLAEKMIDLGKMLVRGGEGMKAEVMKLGVSQNPLSPPPPEPEYEEEEAVAEPAPPPRRSPRVQGIRPQRRRNDFEEAVADHAARTGRNVPPAARSRPTKPTRRPASRATESSADLV